MWSYFAALPLTEDNKVSQISQQFGALAAFNFPLNPH